MVRLGSVIGGLYILEIIIGVFPNWISSVALSNIFSLNEFVVEIFLNLIPFLM